MFHQYRLLADPFRTFRNTGHCPSSSSNMGAIDAPLVEEVT
ncbi:hypothetical protein [Rubellimicrobium roseum]|nr:hypothetical protein [Rubellimicrobium roseum]